MATGVKEIKSSQLTLVKQIGEGGFSSVYQMTWIHPSLGPIEVAAKKLTSRDVTELNIMSGLDHPNIVKILGVVDEPMEFMLILELCENGSLTSYLKELKGKQLSEKQFYDWAEQAARPLEYLRKKHIIHKDVKSQNYMITLENNLKLGDFGIAKNAARTLCDATTRASYPWMAPELLRDGVLSPKYDIFAYAVVLWELRTGKVPFEGLEYQVIAWRVCHLNQRLSIPDDCPEPIKTLMTRCWESDWNKRPSIEEVISVILEAAANPEASGSTSEVGEVSEKGATKTITTQETSRPAAADSLAAAAAAAKVRYPAIISGSWKLQREFGHSSGRGKLSCASGVAVNPSNQDIAIADFASPVVKVFSRDGSYKFTMDTTEGLEYGRKSNPCQVTCNAQGTTYFVTDMSNQVKCFDSLGQHKDPLKSPCPQDSNATSLIGLAIDNKECLLIGDCSKKQVHRHSPDGSYLNSIDVSIVPKCIEVTSEDTIVVADEWSTTPQIVSNTGKLLYTLEDPGGVEDASGEDNEFQWNPQGVYCHEDVILIANYKTPNILCYSIHGTYLGDIPVKCRWPRGLGMTTDGRKLLVCDPWLEVLKVYTLHES